DPARVAAHGRDVRRREVALARSRPAVVVERDHQVSAEPVSDEEPEATAGRIAAGNHPGVVAKDAGDVLVGIVADRRFAVEAETLAWAVLHEDDLVPAAH